MLTLMGILGLEITCRNPVNLKNAYLKDAHLLSLDDNGKH